MDFDAQKVHLHVTFAVDKLFFSRQSDLSLSECAELLIYRHVLPERERARRADTLNTELKSRLEVGTPQSNAVLRIRIRDP